MGNPKRQIGPFNFTSDEDHPQFVSAVARGFSILRCFDHGEQYLGNLEIARRTGLPKPTVSRLTFTLSTLGYLSYSRAQEKYALGTAVLSLGHAYLQCNPVVAIARPLMQELAEHSGARVARCGGARIPVGYSPGLEAQARLTPQAIAARATELLRRT